MEGLNSGLLRTIQLLIRAGIEHTPSGLQFQCSWTLCLHSFFTVQIVSYFYWIKCSPSYPIKVNDVLEVDLCSFK